MTRHEPCQCCQGDECGSSGFLFGLIVGLIIGAVIAILIYRHNKSEVVEVLKRKINKFISRIESNKDTETYSQKKVHPKTTKSHPKTFLVK
ncbi:MAG: YtxH domain-containing protein [Candidatus Shapirobacteria bacterium]|jgi:gas vesicle protein